jgi:hypothetical protein
MFPLQWHSCEVNTTNCNPIRTDCPVVFLLFPTDREKVLSRILYYRNCVALLNLVILIYFI